LSCRYLWRRNIASAVESPLTFRLIRLLKAPNLWCYWWCDFCQSAQTQHCPQLIEQRAGHRGPLDRRL
jgi:hypothetical protein